MSAPLNIVILAAGLGTRMKSSRAKVLHRAGGKALIEHVVDTALALTAPERIFGVVGHQAEQVRQILEPRGIGFIYQAEQKGTGHALLVGRDALSRLDGHLIVLYGDCPLLSENTLRQLIDQQTGSEAAATIVTTVFENPPAWGRIIRDSRGMVRAIVEEKAATPEQLAIREVNAGVYCFRAGMFWEHVDEIQPNNPAREYYLTDMIEILNRAGSEVAPLRIEDSREVMGINTRVELAEVDRIFRERTARRLMLEGVTIEKPETVTIDDGVHIGMDTVVEPFAQILGNTEIGADCRIGVCSIIQDSYLGDGVDVGPFTMVGTSRVEHGARIGPYSRLRLENHVEAGAHVGNFVELKKTRLGAGSKALHLAYLGDSTIGRDVNIGAGTITCNFDGRRKHSTKIGDRSFVGSNSTLVAPVEIGEGSYLGAGSVITEAVPSEALALGRARQVVKDGWARKRRGEI